MVPPSSTGGLAGSAEAFCAIYCRQPDDTCPFGWARDRCPLWQFVQANLPTETCNEPMGDPAEEQVRTRACPARNDPLAAGPDSARRLGKAGFDPDEGHDWPL